MSIGTNYLLFQRSIKRMKTSRSSLPLLRHQEPSTSSSTPSSSSSQEVLENPSGKPPFDIFSKLLELHEEFKESDEYTVCNSTIKFYLYSFCHIQCSLYENCFPDRLFVTIFSIPAILSYKTEVKIMRRRTLVRLHII